MPDTVQIPEDEIFIGFIKEVTWTVWKIAAFQHPDHKITFDDYFELNKSAFIDYSKRWQELVYNHFDEKREKEKLKLQSFRKKLENITIDELLSNPKIVLELFDEHFK